MVAEVVGKVIVVPSVPARIIELLAVRVFAAAIVKVPVEAVIVSPLIEVAVATPIFGVTRVGEVAKTKTVPLPVVVISPRVPALS